MKQLLILVLAIFYGEFAIATEMPELAKEKNCVGCHAIEKKVVGPAWSKVAKRYQGNKDGTQILVEKIKSGGAGVWGLMPMPAQAITHTEAETLAMFILNLNNESYAAR